MYKGAFRFIHLKEYIVHGYIHGCVGWSGLNTRAVESYVCTIIQVVTSCVSCEMD